MLVLSRKPGEEVVIGDHIRLTVVAIRGNRVRLGVTAPPSVLIQRAECSKEAEDLGASAGVRRTTLEAEP
jgi:carbon storage regulator